MKKILLTLAMAVALVLAIGTVSAFAANTVQSPQKLFVDDVEISCEVYNIDGYNYFKLRDVAAMVNNSGNQFSVNYDEAEKCIDIVTGEAYEPVGGELVPGTDKSSTAVVSPQKLKINGDIVTGLSAYNIGGFNYFKLRDLGEFLGFTVDYDSERNAIVVSTHAPRTEAEVYAFECPGFDKEIKVEDKIFNEDVIITGDFGSVVFHNCEFKGNVINKSSKGGIAAISWDCVFAEGSKLILQNSKKEADVIADAFPKFSVEKADVEVVADECFGSLLSFGNDLKLNGKTYSMKDVTVVYDAPTNSLVEYTDQEITYYMVCQFWEKGEQKIVVLGGC